MLEHELEHEHVALNQTVRKKLNRKHVMMEHALVRVLFGHRGEHVQSVVAVEHNQDHEHVLEVLPAAMKPNNRAVQYIRVLITLQPINVRVQSGLLGEHVRLLVEKEEHRQEPDHVRVIIVILN